MANETNMKAAEPAKNNGKQETTPPVLVVDFGKAQSKKKVKRLRKGNGKLIERVNDLVKDLVESGTIQTTAQPVVVVVREREKMRSPFNFMK